METIYPTAEGFSGFYSVGFRKNPFSVTQTQRVGSIVVKRNYTIAGTELRPDDSGGAVRVADAFETYSIDGEDVAIVTHENDIAPYKAEADLIVMGFYQSGNGGEVRVMNEENAIERLWFQRAQNSEMANDPDTGENLFGWEQRALVPQTVGAGCSADYSPRVADTGYDPTTETGGFSSDPNHYPSLWPVPATEPQRDPLHPAGYDNRFYNAYRRCWKRLSGHFPYFSGSQMVSIIRNWPGGSETVRFRLADEQLNARFYYYCGHGPDRESRWCDEGISLVKDTLVVEPEHHRAYVLWRGVWNFDDWSVDQYRRLVVDLEE